MYFMTTLLSCGRRPCACHVSSCCSYYSIFAGFWSFHCTLSRKRRSRQRALPTEVQEKYIGRRKYSDIELEDEEKDPRAHNIISQDNRDDEEHKIVRMNVVFANPGEGIRGTYFIGYARHWDVTRQMLTNMFTKNDRLLEYSTAKKGQLFFIPSKEILEKIAEGEMF